MSAPPIGFLHTAEVHVATFGRLTEELAPGRPVRHLVDERLLADARAAGLTPDLAARVHARLAELAADGAAVIVCTCSTIGALAETPAAADGTQTEAPATPDGTQTGAPATPDGTQTEAPATALGVPVLRADRPMAEAAVAAGRRIGVLVTTESTVEPTVALLRESATRAGTPVTLTPVVVSSAWPLFEAGALDDYHAVTAEHATGLVPDVDVIVLAQASMAPAAELIRGVPVLTSPRSAVQAAIAAVTT